MEIETTKVPSYLHKVKTENAVDTMTYLGHMESDLSRLYTATGKLGYLEHEGDLYVSGELENLLREKRGGDIEGVFDTDFKYNLIPDVVGDTKVRRNMISATMYKLNKLHSDIATISNNHWRELSTNPSLTVTIDAIKHQLRDQITLCLDCDVDLIDIEKVIGHELLYGLEPFYD